MKKMFLSLYSALICLSALSASAQLYWDINGTAAGAGGATPSGTWDTLTANWNTDGTGGAGGTVGMWSDGNTAYFAAGSDATGSYTVTVDGTQSPAQITFGYGDVTLSGGTLDFPSGGLIQADATSSTINSVLSGGEFAALNKLGFGTVVLGGNNTFSNIVSLVQGTLRMGTSGDILPAAEVDISTGATLDLNNFNVGIGTLGGGGTYLGTLNLGSGTLTNLGAVDSSTFSGPIIGSGGITKVGPTSSTWAIANVAATTTFSGKTTILGGTLSIRYPGDLGADPVSYVPDQITLDTGGKLLLRHTVASIAETRGIYVGAGGGTIGIQSGQAPTVACNITGPGTLTKTSDGGPTGNINLTGTNTFGGGFIITGGGVRFNSDIAAGTGAITISPEANIFLLNLFTGGGTSTVTNAITVNDPGANFVDIHITVAQSLFILSGPISGVGPIIKGQQKGSSGMVVLSGDNSGWSGGLNFQRGPLALGHKNALGSTAMVIQPTVLGNDDANSLAVNFVNLSAWTPLTGADAVATPVVISIVDSSFNFGFAGTNALELSGPIYLGDTTNYTPIITVTNSGGTILSGVISGATGIGLTKDGVDTLTLSGNNTYDGSTTIDAGTLVVDAPGSLAGGGVVVNSGGTLGGDGTINGSVAVNGGGSVGAGSSPGTLTLASGLSLSADATNVWELSANSAANAGTDFDQIVLTGGDLLLDASSVLQVHFIGSVNFADSFWLANHSWKIINGSNPGSTSFGSIDGTNGVTAGTFAVSADTTGVYLNYTAGSVTPSVAVPRITSITGAGTTSVIVNYTNTVAGTNYVLQYNTNLNSTTWINVTTNQSTGTTASQTNNPAADTAQRYYRVYYVN